MLEKNTVLYRVCILALKKKNVTPFFIFMILVLFCSYHISGDDNIVFKFVVRESVKTTGRRTHSSEEESFSIANGLNQPGPQQRGDAYLIEILKIGCNTKFFLSKSWSDIDINCRT